MRLAYLDILKFVAIFMVVWGHMLGIFVEDGEFVVARNFIEGVNMPLFFAISGYFLVKPIRDMNIGKIARIILRYVYPVIVVSLVFSLCRLAVASPVECIAYGVVVFKSYWFVWSLVLCILIAFVVSVIAHKTSKAIGVLCGLAFFTALMIPTASTISIRTVHFTPFFLVGCILGEGHCGFRKLGMLSALCYLLIAVFAGNLRKNGLSYYANDFVWYTVMKSPSVVAFEIGRVFIGLLGILGFVTMCKLLTEKWPGIGLLSFLGTTTLGVYLLHWPLIPYLTRIATSIGAIGAFTKLMYVAIFSIVVFAVCHCVTYYTMKFRLSRRFLWMLG